VVSPAAATAMAADPAPPMGRLIRADEVAALVAYLLSPPAAPITGQEIRICGGSSLER
jgi:NAD(P)-dependent dehydrogenase (short-subunit alcohol dehydrogenase family)